MRYHHGIATILLLVISSFMLSGCFSTEVKDDLDFPAQIDDLKNSTPQNEEEQQPTIESDIPMKNQVPTQSNQVSDSTAQPEQPQQNLPQQIDQFERIEQKAGSGVPAQNGDEITVHYTGMLTSGQVFDSSLNRGQPFSFVLGQGQVIQGWDQGLVGAQKNGQYRLLIPSAMGYGERGAGQSIPPNADLIFDVEVIDIKTK